MSSKLCEKCKPASETPLQHSTKHSVYELCTLAQKSLLNV